MPGISAKHFYWIDWLRFLAALMVAVCHVRGGHWVEWARLAPANHTPLLEAFFVLTRPGYECVIVFFVLSGFLIGGKLIEQSFDKTFDPVRYAIDRFARIGVPLAPAILFSLFVTWWIGGQEPLFNWIGSFFALQGLLCDVPRVNAPLWSLTYEVWFYFLGGCSACLVLKRKSRVLAFLGIVASFIVFTHLTASYLSCWLIGAFSYRLLLTDRLSWGKLTGSLVLIFLGVLDSQLSSSTASWPQLSNWSFIDSIPPRDIGLIILSTGIALFLTSVCLVKPKSAWLLHVDEWGSRLAAFSYTLYLTHYPLLHLWDLYVPERASRFDTSSFLLFVIKILSCLLFAWLFYLPFEARTSAVKTWLQRLTFRLNPAQTAGMESTAT